VGGNSVTSAGTVREESRVPAETVEGQYHSWKGEEIDRGDDRETGKERGERRAGGERRERRERNAPRQLAVIVLLLPFQLLPLLIITKLDIPNRRLNIVHTTSPPRPTRVILAPVTPPTRPPPSTIRPLIRLFLLQRFLEVSPTSPDIHHHQSVLHCFRDFRSADCFGVGGGLGGDGKPGRREGAEEGGVAVAAGTGVEDAGVGLGERRLRIVGGGVLKVVKEGTKRERKWSEVSREKEGVKEIQRLRSQLLRREERKEQGKRTNATA
jgi:hypothetical protein